MDDEFMLLEQFDGGEWEVIAEYLSSGEVRQALLDSLLTPYIELNNFPDENGNPVGVPRTIMKKDLDTIIYRMSDKSLTSVYWNDLRKSFFVVSVQTRED